MQKSIQWLETNESLKFGIKGVHVFWIYSLLKHEDGLTASEIAAENKVNRSLVSREIKKLYSEHIIDFGNSGKNTKKYNQRIKLTEKGKQIAKEIVAIAMCIQEKVDTSITEKELEIFYSVLNRLTSNLSRLINEKNPAKGAV